MYSNCDTNASIDCKLNNQLNEAIEKLNCSSNSSVTLNSLRDACISLCLNEQDYIIEGKIQRIVEKVINLIKINRELNSQITKLDQNIGLLIKNNKLVSNNKEFRRIKKDYLKAKKSKKKNILNSSKLNKDIESKIESYQHLFYALQTQPKYLCNLLFSAPTFRVSSFFKNCIFFLFGSETNEREVHLLSSLLKEALYEEVKNKINSPDEIIDGDPIIVTIALDCHRAHRQTIFDFVKPVILEILAQKELNLCLDPIALYKNRHMSSKIDLNNEDQIEESTIQIDQALSDSEVISHLNENIPFTINYSEKLLQVITSDKFIASIPFGIKYICKYLVCFLKEKFENFNEDLKTKVIMNVIFYRFIRPCILFPEAYFNLQDCYKPPTLKSRINLSNVCKLLKTAAVGEKTLDFLKTYSHQLEQLSNLNQFIEKAWISFKKLIESVVSVNDIAYSSMLNEFKDELNPPQITITVQEIIEAHALLLKYRNEIAPKVDDPVDQEFQQLLDDCGSLPEDANQLIGGNNSNLDFLRLDELMTMELTLHLKKKKINDITLIPDLTIKVKQALIELIQLRPTCKDLNQVLFRKAEEKEIISFLKYKNSINWYLSEDLKQFSVLFSPIGNSFNSLLDFTIANMRITEARNFDEILLMLKNDIVSRLQYRKKRCHEINELEATLNTLTAKKKCIQDILEHYQKYLNMCRESYHLNFNLNRITQGNNQKPCFKYSAFKLKEKGILLSLGEIKPFQLKKIQFELSPNSEFNLQIELKMLQEGSEMEKVKLDLQDLLKYQYDGVKVVNFLGKACWDINLLLCLINQKFYLKKNS